MLNRLLSWCTNISPIWVLLGGVLALIHPPLFTWFRGDRIVWGLAVIMLGMGITLSVEDFRKVVGTPRPIAMGFLLGYLFAQAFGYDRIIRRTVSIEVGMQNSGLAVVLARKHFTDPLTAVPCAISSVFHSVIGSLLAGIWRFRR